MDVIHSIGKISTGFAYLIATLMSFNSFAAPDQTDEFTDLSGYDNDIVLSKMQTNFELIPLKNDSFGDKIDLSSGKVQFSYTDVSIPLNSHLDMSVRRSFKDNSLLAKYNDSLGFGDWSLEIPHVNLTLMYRYNEFTHGWGTNNECNNLALNQGDVEVDESWKGATLNIPGQTTESMLRNGTENGDRLITKSNWSIECMTRSDGKGEGFRAKSPQGITYYFDIKKLFKQPNLILYGKLVITKVICMYRR
ncbi:hypothetical protein L1D44_19860 [Shewanella sp. Isolate13]|uniref:hypothetical protein n=1 Tax=Shewanella sp. Isolate13 TaxID=2908531 RepID=UPI001EFE370C|nr:hypothetical protein [Shewanella sp. Isolate13]MCG9732047.1 hypothetical protein [Shewanella sp. Isolate13]